MVAVAIGGDVAVYADSADNNGVADDLVVLSGRTLADISFTNVQAVPVTPPVVIPPPVTPPPPGTGGNDSIQGTANADTLNGGAGTTPWTAPAAATRSSPATAPT